MDCVVHEFYARVALEAEDNQSPSIEAKKPATVRWALKGRAEPVAQPAIPPKHEEVGRFSSGIKGREVRNSEAHCFVTFGSPRGRGDGRGYGYARVWCPVRSKG